MASERQGVSTAPAGAGALLYWPIRGMGVDDKMRPSCMIGYWEDRTQDWVWQGRAVRLVRPDVWQPLPTPGGSDGR